MSQQPSFKSSCISSPDSYVEGSVTMDHGLEEQSGRTCTLIGLWVYETPLSRPLLQFISHDFLIVRVSVDVTDQESKIDMLIRAEKYNNNNAEGTVNDAGIRVKLVDNIEKDAKALFSAQDLNATTTIGEITQILTSVDRNYHILDNNCWKYASVGFETLLDKFGHVEPAKKYRFSNFERILIICSRVCVEVVEGMNIGLIFPQIAVVHLCKALRGGKQKKIFSGRIIDLLDRMLE